MWGTAQTPSRPALPLSMLDGRQQAHFFHRLLSEQSLCLHLVFHNCLSNIYWTSNFNIHLLLLDLAYDPMFLKTKYIKTHKLFVCNRCKICITGIRPELVKQVLIRTLKKLLLGCAEYRKWCYLAHNSCKVWVVVIHPAPGHGWLIQGRGAWFKPVTSSLLGLWKPEWRKRSQKGLEHSYLRTEP